MAPYRRVATGARIYRSSPGRPSRTCSASSSSSHLTWRAERLGSFPKTLFAPALKAYWPSSGFISSTYQNGSPDDLLEEQFGQVSPEMDDICSMNLGLSVDDCYNRQASEAAGQHQPKGSSEDQCQSPAKVKVNNSESQPLNFCTNPVQQTRTPQLPFGQVNPHLSLSTAPNLSPGDAPRLQYRFDPMCSPTSPQLQTSMFSSICDRTLLASNLHRTLQKSEPFHRDVVAQKSELVSAPWFGAPQISYTRFIVAYKISLKVHL